jgi:PBP1b-binding outer membrane lipoprotein LpoB
MRLKQMAPLRAAFALVTLLIVPGCSQQHGVKPQPDAGAEDSDPTDLEPGAEPTVELAPSGAEVAPAATVMSSGNFQMVGSLSVSSGQTSASESYELRPAPIALRLKTR